MKFLFFASSVLAVSQFPAWYNPTFCKPTQAGFECPNMPLITANNLCLKPTTGGRIIQYIAGTCTSGAANALFTIRGSNNSNSFRLFQGTGYVYVDATGTLYTPGPGVMTVSTPATFTMLDYNIFTTGAKISTSGKMVGLKDRKLVASTLVSASCQKLRVSKTLPISGNAALNTACMGGGVILA